MFQKSTLCCFFLNIAYQIGNSFYALTLFSTSSILKTSFNYIIVHYSKKNNWRTETWFRIIYMAMASHHLRYSWTFLLIRKIQNHYNFYASQVQYRLCFMYWAFVNRVRNIRFILNFAVFVLYRCKWKLFSSLSGI